MRRMMYWWHLVHIDQSEVLHKFYVVQKLNRSKDYWVCQLEKDKKGTQFRLVRCKGKKLFKRAVQKFSQKKDRK